MKRRLNPNYFFHPFLVASLRTKIPKIAVNSNLTV